MEREIYLDNSATTRAYPRVCERMTQALSQYYGNPSSLHRKGMEAEKLVKESRAILAGLWKVQEQEIIFTSGGTESDNLAIIGSAMANRRRGMHIVTDSVEHPAVSAAMQYLEEQGFSVTRLPSDDRGRISLSSLQEAVRPDTILVSMMFVNNEVGAVMPVQEAGQWLKAVHPHILFHVDGVQAFGKYRIYPRKMGIDLLSVSGHKIHGPKGIGALYVAKGTKITPLIYGGDQQKGIRSGTENVPGIIGLGEAAKEIYTGFEEKIQRLYGMKIWLEESLMALEDVKLHGPGGMEGAPHIVSAGFGGIRSEVLLHALEDRGIYVSSGSACATNKPGLSPTLQAMGLKEAWMTTTLRFSLSEFTTKEELEYTVQMLGELLPSLRRFVRR